MLLLKCWEGKNKAIILSRKLLTGLALRASERQILVSGQKKIAEKDKLNQIHNKDHICVIFCYL